jgi:hypothetical protein
VLAEFTEEFVNAAFAEGSYGKTVGHGVAAASRAAPE